jgi:hypothetical protein
MRLARGCLVVLRFGVLRHGVLRPGKSRSGVPLSLHRCQPGTSVLLSLEVLLGAGDRGRRRIQIRRISFGRSRDPGSRYGLTRVAHFLHRRAAAASQAGDTDKYRNEAQHKDNGH